jgi:hypothetical protein
MTAMRAMAMAQERDELDTARALAVRALKNQLELAVKVLREVKDARVTVAMEADAIDSARSAFRHAVEALDRMPQLSAEDMRAVQSLIDEFRSALSELNL